MTNASAEPSGTGMPGFVAYLPPAWVAIVILLDVKGALSAYPALADYRLPDSVFALIYASLIAGGITVLWGLFLLALAFNRSQRFPRHFLVWQVAVILWLVAREIYILAMPDFVFSPINLAWTAAEIAIGVALIHLVRRSRDTAALFSNRETERPSVLFSVILGLLGALFGGALGFGVGLLSGIVIAEATDMSCFEGACGYFAFFLGLGGTLLGAIAGAALMVWLPNRRKAAA